MVNDFLLNLIWKFVIENISFKGYFYINHQPNFDTFFYVFGLVRGCDWLEKPKPKFNGNHHQSYWIWQTKKKSNETQIKSMAIRFSFQTQEQNDQKKHFLITKLTEENILLKFHSTWILFNFEEKVNLIFIEEKQWIFKQKFFVWNFSFLFCCLYSEIIFG